MADPWQECMDYAVDLARKAGEVSINYLEVITLFTEYSMYIVFEQFDVGYSSEEYFAKNIN